jgi:hypothetical protein
VTTGDHRKLGERHVLRAGLVWKMSPLPPKITVREDGRLVGTPSILESLRVTLATDPTDPPIPAPSVFVDDRGEIHNVRVGNVYAERMGVGPSTSLQQTRYNILYTKAGVLRSGDLHKVSQHDFVFEGSARVWLLQKDGSTSSQTYGPHSYLCIPPYTPHIFEFVQDTAMAEWWDADEFCAWFYRPYRELVERSIATKAVSKPGRLVQYSLQPRAGSFYLSWKFLAGLAVGISVRGWVGGRR